MSPGFLPVDTLHFYKKNFKKAIKRKTSSRRSQHFSCLNCNIHLIRTESVIK